MRFWPVSLTQLGKPGSKRGLVQAQLILLIVVCFALGLTLGAVWVANRRTPQNSISSQDQQSLGLSGPTQTILSRLDAPLEVRFYRLLDPASVPDTLQAFAGRVDQLLVAYEQAANGRIKLTRCDSSSYTNANAALADGLTAFNQDQGTACFLGVALAQKGRKEVLSRLAPEWEPALELDLTRAIARLIEVPALTALPAAKAPMDPAILEEVKRQVPNLNSLSSQDADRLLREAAFKDFKAAAADLDAQVKQAEQRLNEAKKAGTQAEQKAALDELQQLRARQIEKFKQVMSRLDLQLEALHQLQTANP